jgi:hypothetical protein
MQYKMAWSVRLAAVPFSNPVASPYRPHPRQLGKKGFLVRSAGRPEKNKKQPVFKPVFSHFLMLAFGAIAQVELRGV